MATFRFPGRNINIHWNGYDIKGPAGTVFSIPDQLYEEFESDIRPVEPSLEWIEDNEFDALQASVSAYTLEASSPITISNTSSGRSISFSSGTAQNGALLAADGSGGVIYIPASTSGINSVIGVNPISAAISGGIVSVSLNANYSTSTHTHPYIELATLTAKGDILAATGASAVSALGVGTDGQILSASSGAASGLAWINQSAVTSDNAARIRTQIRNTTGSTLTKGQVVYITGSSGLLPTVAPALATSDATSANTIGVVESDIVNNANGYVTNVGLLGGLDTTGFADGAAVWLSPTVAGSYQTAKPVGPDHGVLVGFIIKGGSAGAGELYVYIKNGVEIDEIHDVNISALTNGHALIWSSTASVWQNALIGSSSISTGAITSGHIAAGAVDSSALASGAVVSEKIASSAVTSGHIAAAAVGSAALADGSVVSSKIGASAVTSGHISAGAVGSAAISSGAVNTAKISSGAATSGQLLRADGSGGVTFATVTSGITAAGTVRDNEVVRWDGATGTSIQNSGVVISDSADVFFGGAVASVPITVTANTASVYNIDLSLGNHFILSNTTTASSPVVVATSTASFTSSTTGTITLPTGTTTNDYVLIGVGSDGGTDITCSSSGWTRLAYGAPGTAGYALFLKKIGGSVDTSASFAGLATASCANAITIRSSSGLIALAGYHSSGSAPNPPAVDTLQNATTVVAIGFLDDVATTATAAPSGYVNASYSTVASGFQVMLATKAVATAGTEDPGAFTVGADEAVSFTAVFGSNAGASVALINSPTTSVTGYGTANAYSALIDYAVTSNPITWDSKISWPGTYPPPVNSGGSVIIYTSNGGTTFKGSYVSGY